MFSAVIATYNRCQYASEAIRSVLEQTYPAHEIIVVVDGSTDDTARVLRHTYTGTTVRVIEQPNLGPSIAHNTGIANATGDWICFLDDDDLWHEDKLAVTAEYIQTHTDCKAVRNPVWFFADSPNGPVSAFGFARDFIASSLDECRAAVAEGDPSQNSFEYLRIEGNSFHLMLECNRGALSSSVVQRDVLIRAGGFSPMQTCGDDWTMFVNVARLCEWHTIPRRLGFARLHASQNTGDPLNGLYALAGQINAWYTGRPMPHRIDARTLASEIVRYGPVYRKAVQNYYWSAVRSRRWGTAALIRNAGKFLLPRRRDYAYAMLPPQLTWRWERYILGLYK